jgi:hypothetical protein
MLSGPKAIGPADLISGVPTERPYPTAWSELRVAMVALLAGADLGSS